MSDESLRYLFLHYGPGGNCALERLWLQGYGPTVDFWDQPTNVSSFEELVRHCVERFKSGNYKGVIGHSFGCELAVQVSQQTTRPIELYLISPLRDIPTAFINLAHNLSQASVSTDRKLQLRLAAQAMKTLPNWHPGENLSSDELDRFAELTATIAVDPGYCKAFWAQQEKLNAFKAEWPNLPQFSQACWKSVMVDFLMKHQSSRSKVKAKVFVGVNDPYIGLIQDEKKFWQTVGSKFISVEKSGHSPHLESNVFEMLIKRS